MRVQRRHDLVRRPNDVSECNWPLGGIVPDWSEEIVRDFVRHSAFESELAVVECSKSKKY